MRTTIFLAQLLDAVNPRPRAQEQLVANGDGGGVDRFTKRVYRYGLKRWVISDDHGGTFAAGKVDVSAGSVAGTTFNVQDKPSITRQAAAGELREQVYRIISDSTPY